MKCRLSIGVSKLNFNHMLPHQWTLMFQICYSGYVDNRFCHDGKCLGGKDISFNSDEAFYKNGKPHKALAANW